MLSAIASSILLLAGTGLAVYMLLRRAAFDKAEACALKNEIDTRLATLHELIHTARSETERLESVIEKAAAIESEPPRDTLESLESLADPLSLADPDALRRAAAQLPHLPGVVAGDVFDSNRIHLEIGRLQDQGMSPADIARRLGLPLGEVELRQSIRAA